MHDAVEFGGHEIMLLRFLPALLADSRLGRLAIAFPASNRMLAQRLEALAHPKLALRPWDWVKRPAEPYRALFRFGYARAVRRLCAEERPDTVLIVQGRIENCVVPMLSVPASMPLTSYIPMAHSMREMGRSTGFDDWVRRPLYRRPLRFIVPTASVAAQLARAGAKCPVSVVPNVIDPPPSIDRTQARMDLALPPERRIALFVGRLDVGQKGLDRMLAAIARDAEHLAEWTFLFVGEGPGRTEIEAVADRLGARVDIRLCGSTPDMAAYLAAADLMLIPSRWEGDPLVLLEAMAQRLPVLGSEIDVFVEHLPPGNRTSFETAALAKAMEATLAPEALAAYRCAAAKRMKGTIASSARLFADAVLG
jgi:glycosyltransferase involved in cell wall biosynthesis